MLVYLSLFECRAVILADDQAFAALGREILEQQCGLLTADAARCGYLTAAPCAGVIGRLGDLLAKKLPLAGDRNELADGARWTLG